MLNTSIIKCLNQSNLRLLLGASKVKISSGYVIEFSAVGTDQVTEEVSTTDRRLKKKKMFNSKRAEQLEPADGVKQSEALRLVRIQHNPSFILTDEQCVHTFVLESMSL